MNVAHITPSFYPALAYGGPTESVYRICLAVASSDCEVRVLTTNANGDRVLDLPTDQETRIQEHLSVRYCARQRSESISLSFLLQLPTYLRWADVVHLEAVYSFPTIPTLWLASQLHKPVVWSPRGALARWSGARHPKLKNLYDRMCRLLRDQNLVFHFTSDQERDGSLWRFPGAKNKIIPNGVEIPAEVEKRQATSSFFHLLYLGRLHPIKGIDKLLTACALLNSRQFRDWRLTIAGGGEAAYSEQLQKQIYQLGLQDRVQMIGPVTGQEKENVFAAADVVLVPSHAENFCIVAAEALAREIPVIASQGTPWSGLENHGCGLWVPNDPASLAVAIERIQKMSLRTMGEKGRLWMKDEFTWDRIAAQMVLLYRQARRSA